MQIFRNKTFIAIILIPLCFIFAGAFKGAARSTPRLGASMDSEVRRLLFHNQTSFPLPPGWRISDYSYSDTIITANLKDEAGTSTDFLVAYPLEEIKFRSVGATKSFNVFAIESRFKNNREQQLVERSFYERIKANDNKYFFSNPMMERSNGLYTLIFKRYVFYPALCYALLVAFVFTALNYSALRCSLFPQIAYKIVALAFLVAVGAVLRASYSPEVPTHENGHGIREIRAVLRPDSNYEIETHYGDVYNALLTAGLNALGHQEQNIYILNEVFGSLSIIAIFMLAVAIGLSAPAALFAAAAMCASPMQIWISGSETAMPSMTFFTLSGLSLLVFSIKNKNETLLWSATALLAVASSLHLVSVFIAFVALVFSVYSGIAAAVRDDKKFRQHALLCATAYICWMSLHISCISIDTVEKGKDAATIIGYISSFFNKSNLLWNSSATPAAIPILALFGIFVALKTKPSFSALVISIIPIIAVMGLTVNTCESANIRYQAPMQWIFYLSAAFFADSALPSQKGIFVVSVLAVAWLVACAIPGIASFSKPDMETAEYRFIRGISEEKSSSKIFTKVSIRLPSDKNACGGQLVSEFPDYIRDNRVVWSNLRVPGDDYIYIGLDCYRYDKPEELKNDMLPGGLRRECANACGAGRILSPVYETTLPAAKTRSLWKISTERPRIGFFKCINTVAGENNLQHQE